jgi:hypothetical protein
VYSLSLTPDAQKDIEDLWKASPPAAARIEAFLEQLRFDPEMLNALTIHDFGAHRSEPLHVTKIVSQWRGGRGQPGRDLWRLKLWDLENKGLQYRVIYAYEIRRQRYHILGVIDRDSYDYETDPKHPYTARILRAYADVCE